MHITHAQETCFFKHCIQGKEGKRFFPPAHSAYFVKTIIQASDKKINKEKPVNTINISNWYSMVIPGA